MAAQSYGGLLVDWGGVMTTSVFDAFRAFSESEGLAPEAIGERFRRDPQSRELLIGLETGALAEAAFETRFAAILGVPAAGLIDRMFAGATPDLEMIALVGRIRAAGIRTGLISNSWGTRRYDRKLLATLFDGLVISGEVGLRKPAREIYELGARSIALTPGRCVFVDDLAFNLEPAAALGMATVHHRSCAQTCSELAPLLGLELREPPTHTAPAAAHNDR